MPRQSQVVDDTKGRRVTGAGLGNTKKWAPHYGQELSLPSVQTKAIYASALAFLSCKALTSPHKAKLYTTTPPIIPNIAMISFGYGYRPAAPPATGFDQACACPPAAMLCASSFLYLPKKKPGRRAGLYDVCIRWIVPTGAVVDVPALLFQGDGLNVDVQRVARLHESQDTFTSECRRRTSSRRMQSGHRNPQSAGGNLFALFAPCFPFVDLIRSSGVIDTSLRGSLVVGRSPSLHAGIQRGGSSR